MQGRGASHRLRVVFLVLLESKAFSCQKSSEVFVRLTESQVVDEGLSPQGKGRQNLPRNSLCKSPAWGRPPLPGSLASGTGRFFLGRVL